MAEKSVEQLVQEALDLFDDPSQSVASHVRRAIRIATKRQDYLALLRLYPETFDFTPRTKIDHPAFVDARVNLAALVGAEEGQRQEVQILMRYMRDRAPIGGGDKFHALSIGQIEAQLQQVNEVVEHYSKVPENLTPIDTYHVAKDYDRAGAQVIPLRAELESTLERVKQAVHNVLVDTERQIESGQRRPSTFERAQRYIDASLTRRAPEVLTMFEAAEDAVDRGTPEDLSHALTSCRRIIKGLADALYPATGESITGADGRDRAMTEDAYNNRLLQFAIENMEGSTHKGLVAETLRGLGNRLNRLNELSSKGVHDVVSSAEAETCLMWTYLTVADLLRIADGTSSRLQGETALSDK